MSEPTPPTVPPDAQLSAEVLAARAGEQLLTGLEPALPGAVGDDQFLASLIGEAARGRLRRRPELYVAAVGRLTELVRAGDPLPTEETGVPSDPPEPPLPGRAERAARLLVEFGSAAEPALPTVLDRFLAVPAAGWRELDGLLEALEGLAKIEPPSGADRARAVIADRALPRLREMVRGAESAYVEERRYLAEPVKFSSLRVGATFVLRALGPAARAAESELLALAQSDSADDPARLSALHALTRVAPLSAAAELERRFIPSSPSPDPVGDSWLPSGLVTTLRELTAPETVPTLIRLLSHRAGMVSQTARTALAKVGPAAAAAVPTLLEQANHWGDERAVETLGELGRATAAAAVPVLLQLADDTGRPVGMRLAATAALLRMGLGTSEHRAFLREYLRSPRAGIRVECARMLIELRDPPEPMDAVVPILCGLVQRRELPGEALRLLCRVGPAALTLDERVLASLRELLTDPQAFYYLDELAEAVRELGKLGPELLPTLRELLEANEETEVREALIRAVGDLGRAAESMVPRLKQLVAESHNDRVAGAAEAALEAIAAAAASSASPTSAAATSAAPSSASP